MPQQPWEHKRFGARINNACRPIHSQCLASSKKDFHSRKSLMRSADCQFSGIFNFQNGILIDLFFTDQGGWLAPVGTLWYSQSGTLGCWYLQPVMEESIVPTTPESIDVASGSDPTQRHRQWLVRTIASRFEHWLAVHGNSGKLRPIRHTQMSDTCLYAHASRTNAHGDLVCVLQGQNHRATTIPGQLTDVY